MQLASFFLWLAYTLTSVYFLNFYFKKRRYSVLLLLFFTLYYLSIRPIFILIGADVPIPFYQFQYDFWEDVAFANLLILVWVVSYLFFYKTLAKRDKPNETKYVLNSLNIPILTLVTIILSCIGAVVTFYFVSKVGGISEFVYQVKIEKSLAGLYVIREINAWGLILSGLLFIYSIALKEKKITYVSFFLIFLNSFVIFSWGNRTIIGFFFFMLFTFYFSRVSKLTKKNIVLTILFMFVLANGLRLVREDLHSEAIGHEVNSLEVMSPITAVSLSMHLSQYDGLVLAARDVGRLFDYRDGQDFINGLTAWVPRFIWRDKPKTHNVGLWFRQVYEPEKSNGWPISALGNWFVNGGVIFILLGSFLTAVVTVTTDRFSNKSVVYDYSILVFGVFVTAQGVNTGFVQDSILTFMPFVFFILLSKLRLRIL